MPGTEVEQYLSRVRSTTRRRDATTLLELYTRVTGLEPYLWKNIVAFGTYHYAYASGREGDAPAAAFAPRSTATSVYLSDGVDTYAQLLRQLGPHTSGVGCLYLKNLKDIDLGVLENIIRASFTALTTGTFRYRARDSGSASSG